MKLEILRSEAYAEDGEGGSWTWDGVMHDSEVPPVNQGDYSHSDTGYLFEIYDHRTEGQIHINKRDLELYREELPRSSETEDSAGLMGNRPEDTGDSYGKTQGDGTLQGAVYGLYAYEDITHPDGYTGTVFRAGDLVAVAATDEMEMLLLLQLQKNLIPANRRPISMRRILKIMETSGLAARSS